MDLRSPLGRARGLGSAKSGVEHFWLQRVTAIGLVPLAAWFAFSIARIGGADYDAVRLWLSAPVNASLMILAVVTAVWHGVLGVQVVIEDYVHGHTSMWIGLIATRMLGAFLATAMTVSILKIALGG